LSHLSKSVHIEENSPILTVSNNKMYEGDLSILSSTRILWSRSNPLTEENRFRKQPTLVIKSLVTRILLRQYQK
jgi:hypothetical protein